MRLCKNLVHTILLHIIKLSQHRDTPQLDEWSYDVPEICDGGPCKSAADALRSAVQHMRRRVIEQRQELDDLAQACQELRVRLDQADRDDGLAPWRRALDG